MNKAERLIARIRDAHPDNECLYMEGQCYNFALILREIFEDAEIWWDTSEGHVYTKIGRCWYDIRGKHVKVSSACAPLDHTRGDKPHRWGPRDKRRLSDDKQAGISMVCKIEGQVLNWSFIKPNLV